MKIRKNIEHVLLIVGFAAAVEAAVAFILAAWTYSQFLSDKVFGKYAALLVGDRNAYQICVIYSICAVLFAISALASNYLELRNEERFRVVHWLTLVGILFFAIFIIYLQMPNIIENQTLYQQAITSKSLPVSGLLATLAPLIVWIMRKPQSSDSHHPARMKSE